MDQNKIFELILAFLISIGLMYGGTQLLIKKVTNKVVEQFKREYVPGPYHPGFDPDKIEPKFKQPIQTQPSKVLEDLPSPQIWNQIWEKSRV